MTIPKWIIISLIVISLIGFIDATYLTVEHYQGGVPPCSILEGCEQVTTSQYSKVAGIPVSLGGSIYYLTVLLLSVAYFDTKKRIFLLPIPWLTIIGLLISAWFVYLQLFVIKAICLYCMGSATTSTLLFILGLILIFKLKSPNNKPRNSSSSNSLPAQSN